MNEYVIVGDDNMDVKTITPFLEGVQHTLLQFGLSDIKRGGIQKKASMAVGGEVSAIIGIVGNVKGNVAYSMSENTAKNLVSTMMMGMPVAVFDEMAESAIGELSNMITGHASLLLSEAGYNVNITPPMIMVGHGKILSFIETISVILETPVGEVEINIGLEH